MLFQVSDIHGVELRGTFLVLWGEQLGEGRCHLLRWGTLNEPKLRGDDGTVGTSWVGGVTERSIQICHVGRWVQDPEGGKGGGCIYICQSSRHRKNLKWWERLRLPRRHVLAWELKQPRTDSRGISSLKSRWRWGPRRTWEEWPELEGKWGVAAASEGQHGKSY